MDTPEDRRPFAAHLLLVDDDARIRALLSDYLRANCYAVTLAQNAAVARELMRLMRFDLVILDVMMPGESGLSLSRFIFAQKREPVLLLTARGEPEERIEGFESGADDYLPKPFEPRELLLRIAAITRRGGGRRPGDAPSSATLKMGDCRWESARKELFRGERRIHLTEAERSIIGLLGRHAGQTMGRDRLIDALGAMVGERSIDVHISRLRRKIEPDPRQPRYLQTLRGKGYRLTVD